MTIAFSAEVVSEQESVVGKAFAQPVVLRNETAEEAKVPGGRIALIANYRGFNADARGRKARGAGGAVLDLSAVAHIPASELPLLIQQLEGLAESLDEGIQAASSLSQ